VPLARGVRRMNIFTADLMKYSMMKDMAPRVTGRVLGYGLLFALLVKMVVLLWCGILIGANPELLGGLAHLD